MATTVREVATGRGGDKTAEDFLVFDQVDLETRRSLTHVGASRGRELTDGCGRTTDQLSHSGKGTPEPRRCLTAIERFMLHRRDSRREWDIGSFFSQRTTTSPPPAEIVGERG